MAIVLTDGMLRLYGMSLIATIDALNRVIEPAAVVGLVVLAIGKNFDPGSIGRAIARLWRPERK